MPEQAHTSPTSRKSSDNQRREMEYALSPTPQGNDYQQFRVPSTTGDPSEKAKFGNIFRKLSQRRKRPLNRHLLIVIIVSINLCKRRILALFQTLSLALLNRVMIQIIP